MIIHSQRLVYIDRHAGGPVTPELAAAGRALSPVGEAVKAREARMSRRPVALGDAVERCAKPVAVAIDRLTSKLPQPMRTRLAWCGACSARQIALNGWVSDVRSWVAWKAAVKRALRPALKRA